MDTVTINHEIYLISIGYDSQTRDIYYCLSVQGEVEHFSAKIFDTKGIRGITYTDDLDEFIMSVMSLQPKISKILVEITLGYIDYREVSFPIQLVP
ncbi:hypothetical protein AAIG33_14310 [Phytobacter ursingii]|uniref:hypothetical protein n=1 Tax=Phytobacter ursingii TaxID=1972431 RepID=UPI0031B7AB40